MKKRKLKLKPITRIFLYLISFMSLFIFCEKRVNLLPTEYLEQNAINYTDGIINDAIENVLSDYQNSYIITTNEADEFNLMEINATDISYFKTQLSNEINSEINGNSCTFIPIGSLLNYKLLSGFGFSIPVNMCYVGSAIVQIETELVSSGINQAVYSLTAIVSATVVSLSLENTVSVEVLSQYPLCEVYISGEVPSYRINSTY